MPAILGFLPYMFLFYQKTVTNKSRWGFVVTFVCKLVTIDNLWTTSGFLWNWRHPVHKELNLFSATRSGSSSNSPFTAVAMRVMREASEIWRESAIVWTQVDLWFSWVGFSSALSFRGYCTLFPTVNMPWDKSQRTTLSLIRRFFS
jgi:hypothetical protein